MYLICRVFQNVLILSEILIINSGGCNKVPAGIVNVIGKCCNRRTKPTLFKMGLTINYEVTIMYIYNKYNLRVKAEVYGNHYQ